MKIDKSNWKEYSFKDIASNIVEKITPKKSDLKYYVGLEHLDSGSTHISRFGNPSELKGDKLLAYKGDVIVGKRNAYLKRAAKCDFDLITSAHSFVLRANPDVILPELFVFLLQSDLFWEKAIRISVGSLSPTINWKTLAIQKFFIPPLEQQKDLGEFLWSEDLLIENYKKLKTKLEGYYKSSVNVLNSNSYLNLVGVNNNEKVKSDYIGNLVDINTDNVSNKNNIEIEYIDITSIGYKKLNYNEIKKYNLKDAPSRAKRIVKTGDLIVSLVRPYQQQIVILNNVNQNTLSSTGTAVLRSENKEILSLIYHQLFSTSFIKYCDGVMTGTNYPAITAQDLARFRIFYSDETTQNNNILRIINNIENSIDEVNNIIKKAEEVSTTLINQIFQ